MKPRHKAQSEEVKVKLAELDKQIAEDPKSKKLKTDRAILQELITFLENK